MSPFGRSPKRADDIDFQTLFESGVQRRLLVDADAPRYTILAASDAYCELVDIRRDNLVGCGLF